jgi:uncharacterized protein
MIVLRLILMLLAGALILLALLSFIMAWFLLRPPRMTDGKAAWILKRLTPGDLGLPFTPLTFTIRDQQADQPLKIAAWWIPHNSSHKTALVLHGYADAKVGALAWAPIFHQLGYNLLLPDLRAHGESAGKITTGGYQERHDIDQVINELRARYPTESRHLILFGASLGAAVAAALAADRDDIDAVILDSPYIDFPAAASAHFDLLGIGLRPLHRAATALAQKLSGANFSTVRTIDLIHKSHSPLLLIQGQADAMTPPQHQAQFQSAISHRTDGSIYWILPQVPHLMPLAADPDAYRQRVSDFLSSIENRKSQIENSPLTPSSHPTQ